MSVRRASWEGGPQELRMLQAAMSEAHIILHGPPDLPVEAEILGICGVSAENADQNKYGWMVADFLHWKLLLHGVGKQTAQVNQTWLSSLDITEFLEGVDGVDMINDGTIHKFVGKHEDAIMTIASDNEGFETVFLQRLAESARLAVSQKTILAVLVFAPVTPEQDICVDLGEEKKTYLTAERLRDTVNNAVGGVQLPVVFVTPSPFTGGWLCRPSLMNRPACPAPDRMMRIIAKSCGGAFADRSIRSFTERNTPLMTDAQRDKVKYDDPMPLRPTKLQTDCLHHFQRQIHEALEHRLSVSARDHAFILEKHAAQDPSRFSDTCLEYGPRQGRPLEFWAKHWGSPRLKIDQTHRFEFLGEAFGGTRESQFFHLKYLIAIELDTHPGDWERQVGGVTRELYTSFLQRLMPSVDDAKRVFDTIEFRASSAILAQMVAKAFDLPMPDGVKCRYWHDKMDGVDDGYYRKLQYAFGEALRLFDQAAVLPSEKRHEFKNVRYLRAARWLSAATALKFENGSREDIEDFVGNDVARLIAKIRDAQTALLLENRSVTRAGLNWIASLGLGGEVLPIPGAANPEREDTDLTGQDDQRKTFTPALDAQAAPWPPKSIAWKPFEWKPIASKPIERKWPTQRVATSFAEAESSLTQGDVQAAVKDTLEDFGTQPAGNTENREIQGLTETWNPSYGVKFEVKGDDTLIRSAKSDPLRPKSAGTNFQDDRTHGKFDSDLISGSLGAQEDSANNEAVTWEKASTPVTSSCIASATALETVTDTPIPASIDIDNNVGAWDKILNTSATSNGNQVETQALKTATNALTAPSSAVDDNANFDAWEKPIDTPVTNGGQNKKKVRIVLPEPSEELPDLQNNQIDEPASPTQSPAVTIDDNASAWDKILGTSGTSNGAQNEKQVQMTSLEPSVEGGLKETIADEPAAPSHVPSLAADANTRAGEKISDTREYKEREPSENLPGFEDNKIDEPAALPEAPSVTIDNVSAWDKILGTSVTTNSGQDKKPVPVAFQEPSVDLGVEENKVDEPAVLPHASSVVIDNNAGARDKVVTAGGENQEKARAALLEPSGDLGLEEKKVDDTAASSLTPSATIDDNLSAWDKILGTSSTSNGSQDKEQVGVTLCDPSGDVHDLEDKKVEEPAPAPQTEPAPGTAVEQALKRLTESLMGMRSDSMGDDNAVAQLLQNAAEIVEQEKAAKASGFKGGSSPAENTSYSVQANGNDNGASGVSAGADSGWVMISSGFAQATRNGNEAARVPAEKTTTTSTGLPEASSESTMGHSAAGHVTDLDGSGEPMENGEKTAAAEVIANGDQAASAADPEVNLASGDDFWSKVKF